MRITGTIAHINNKKNALISSKVKQYQLSHGQAIALNKIAKHKQISQEMLVRDIKIDKSAMTRILASLKEKGYIIKQKDPMNKKYQLISLTDKGKEIMNYVDQSLDETVDEMLKGFTQEEIKQLEDYLERMNRNLNDK